jgi:hypothetical protein
MPGGANGAPAASSLNAAPSNDSSEKSVLESLGVPQTKGKGPVGAGNAAGASISGGSGGGPAPGSERGPSRSGSLHERIRDLGNQVPQDQHTVGLNANVASHIPE